MTPVPWKVRNRRVSEVIAMENHARTALRLQPPSLCETWCYRCGPTGEAYEPRALCDSCADDPEAEGPFEDFETSQPSHPMSSAPRTVSVWAVIDKDVTLVRWSRGGWVDQIALCEGRPSHVEPDAWWLPDDTLAQVRKP